MVSTGLLSLRMGVILVFRPNTTVIDKLINGGNDCQVAARIGAFKTGHTCVKQLGV